MASELREVWRVIGYGFDDVFMDQESAERMQFVGVDEAVIERLPLLTPEAKAVLDRACKLQDMADATGVDMERCRPSVSRCTAPLCSIPGSIVISNSPVSQCSMTARDACGEVARRLPESHSWPFISIAR